MFLLAKQALEEKQEECNKRLQEISDQLMVTENKIIGSDSGTSVSSEGLANLQQQQAEHQVSCAVYLNKLEKWITRPRVT